MLTLIQLPDTDDDLAFHALDGEISPSMTFPQFAESSEASHVAPRLGDPTLVVLLVPGSSSPVTYVP